MEIALALSILVNIAVLCAWVALCTSPNNKRRAACALLASARAQDETVNAQRGIERRKEDLRAALERRYVEVENPSIGINDVNAETDGE